MHFNLRSVGIVVAASHSPCVARRKISLRNTFGLTYVFRRSIKVDWLWAAVLVAALLATLLRSRAHCSRYFTATTALHNNDYAFGSWIGAYVYIGVYNIKIKVSSAGSLLISRSRTSGDISYFSWFPFKDWELSVSARNGKSSTVYSKCMRPTVPLLAWPQTTHVWQLVLWLACENDIKMFYSLF